MNTYTKMCRKRETDWQKWETPKGRYCTRKTNHAINEREGGRESVGWLTA